MYGTPSVAVVPRPAPRARPPPPPAPPRPAVPFGGPANSTSLARRRGDGRDDVCGGRPPAGPARSAASAARPALLALPPGPVARPGRPRPVGRPTASRGGRGAGGRAPPPPPLRAPGRGTLLVPASLSLVATDSLDRRAAAVFPRDTRGECASRWAAGPQGSPAGLVRARRGRPGGARSRVPSAGRGWRRSAAGDHAASPRGPPPAVRPEGCPCFWPGRGMGSAGAVRRGREHAARAAGRARPRGSVGRVCVGRTDRSAAEDYAASPRGPSPAVRPEGCPRHWPTRGAGPGGRPPGEVARGEGSRAGTSAGERGSGVRGAD